MAMPVPARIGARRKAVFSVTITLVLSIWTMALALPVMAIALAPKIKSIIV
jgi:hypothetical protein